MESQEGGEKKSMNSVAFVAASEAFHVDWTRFKPMPSDNVAEVILLLVPPGQRAYYQSEIDRIDKKPNPGLANVMSKFSMTSNEALAVWSIGIAPPRGSIDASPATQLNTMLTSRAEPQRQSPLLLQYYHYLLQGLSKLPRKAPSQLYAGLPQSCIYSAPYQVGRVVYWPGLALMRDDPASLLVETQHESVTKTLVVLERPQAFDISGVSRFRELKRVLLPNSSFRVLRTLRPEEADAFVSALPRTASNVYEPDDEDEDDEDEALPKVVPEVVVGEAAKLSPADADFYDPKRVAALKAQKAEQLRREIAAEAAAAQGNDNSDGVRRKNLAAASEERHQANVAAAGRFASPSTVVRQNIPLIRSGVMSVAMAEALVSKLFESNAYCAAFRFTRALAQRTAGNGNASSLRAWQELLHRMMPLWHGLFDPDDVYRNFHVPRRAVKANTTTTAAAPPANPTTATEAPGTCLDGLLLHLLLDAWGVDVNATATSSTSGGGGAVGEAVPPQAAAAGELRTQTQREITLSKFRADIQRRRQAVDSAKHVADAPVSHTDWLIAATQSIMANCLLVPLTQYLECIEMMEDVACTKRALDELPEVAKKETEERHTAQMQKARQNAAAGSKGGKAKQQQQGPTAAGGGGTAAAKAVPQRADPLTLRRKRLDDVITVTVNVMVDNVMAQLDELRAAVANPQSVSGHAVRAVVIPCGTQEAHFAFGAVVITAALCSEKSAAGGQKSFATVAIITGGAFFHDTIVVNDKPAAASVSAGGARQCPLMVLQRVPWSALNRRFVGMCLDCRLNVRWPTQAFDTTVSRTHMAFYEVLVSTLGGHVIAANTLPSFLLTAPSPQSAEAQAATTLGVLVKYLCWCVCDDDTAVTSAILSGSVLPAARFDSRSRGDLAYWISQVCLNRLHQHLGGAIHVRCSGINDDDVCKVSYRKILKAVAHQTASVALEFIQCSFAGAPQDPSHQHRSEDREVIAYASASLAWDAAALELHDEKPLDAVVPSSALIALRPIRFMYFASTPVKLDEEGIILTERRENSGSVRQHKQPSDADAAHSLVPLPRGILTTDATLIDNYRNSNDNPTATSNSDNHAGVSKSVSAAAHSGPAPSLAPPPHQDTVLAALSAVRALVDSAGKALKAKADGGTDSVVCLARSTVVVQEFLLRWFVTLREEDVANARFLSTFEKQKQFVEGVAQLLTKWIEVSDALVPALQRCSSPPDSATGAWVSWTAPQAGVARYVVSYYLYVLMYCGSCARMQSSSHHTATSAFLQKSYPLVLDLSAEEGLLCTSGNDVCALARHAARVASVVIDQRYQEVIPSRHFTAFSSIYSESDPHVEFLMTELLLPSFVQKCLDEHHGTLTWEAATKMLNAGASDQQNPEDTFFWLLQKTTKQVCEAKTKVGERFLTIRPAAVDDNDATVTLKNGASVFAFLFAGRGATPALPDNEVMVQARTNNRTTWNSSTYVRVASIRTEPALMVDRLAMCLAQGDLSLEHEEEALFVIELLSQLRQASERISAVDVHRATYRLESSAEQLTTIVQALCQRCLESRSSERKISSLRHAIECLVFLLTAERLIGVDHKRRIQQTLRRARHILASYLTEATESGLRPQFIVECAMSVIISVDHQDLRALKNHDDDALRHRLRHRAVQLFGPDPSKVDCGDTMEGDDVISSGGVAAGAAVPQDEDLIVATHVVSVVLRSRVLLELMLREYEAAKFVPTHLYARLVAIYTKMEPLIVEAVTGNFVYLVDTKTAAPTDSGIWTTVLRVLAERYPEQLNSLPSLQGAYRKCPQRLIKSLLYGWKGDRDPSAEETLGERILSLAAGIGSRIGDGAALAAERPADERQGSEDDEGDEEEDEVDPGPVPLPPPGDKPRAARRPPAVAARASQKKKKPLSSADGTMAAAQTLLQDAWYYATHDCLFHRKGLTLDPATGQISSEIPKPMNLFSHPAFLTLYGGSVADSRPPLLVPYHRGYLVRHPVQHAPLLLTRQPAATAPQQQGRQQRRHGREWTHYIYVQTTGRGATAQKPIFYDTFVPLEVDTHRKVLMQRYLESPPKPLLWIKRLLVGKSMAPKQQPSGREKEQQTQESSEAKLPLRAQVDEPTDESSSLYFFYNAPTNQIVAKNQSHHVQFVYDVTTRWMMSASQEHPWSPWVLRDVLLPLEWVPQHEQHPELFSILASVGRLSHAIASMSHREVVFSRVSNRLPDTLRLLDVGLSFSVERQTGYLCCDHMDGSYLKLSQFIPSLPRTKHALLFLPKDAVALGIQDSVRDGNIIVFAAQFREQARAVEAARAEGSAAAKDEKVVAVDVPAHLAYRVARETGELTSTSPLALLYLSHQYLISAEATDSLVAYQKAVRYLAMCEQNRPFESREYALLEHFFLLPDRKQRASLEYKHNRLRDFVAIWRSTTATHGRHRWVVWLWSFTILRRSLCLVRLYRTSDGSVADAQQKLVELLSKGLLPFALHQYVVQLPRIDASCRLPQPRLEELIQLARDSLNITTVLVQPTLLLSAQEDSSSERASQATTTTQQPHHLPPEVAEACAFDNWPASLPLLWLCGSSQQQQTTRIHRSTPVDYRWALLLRASGDSSALSESPPTCDQILDSLPSRLADALRTTDYSVRVTDGPTIWNPVDALVVLFRRMTRWFDKMSTQREKENAHWHCLAILLSGKTFANIDDPGAPACATTILVIACAMAVESGAAVDDECSEKGGLGKKKVHAANDDDNEDDESEEQPSLVDLLPKLPDRSLADALAILDEKEFYVRLIEKEGSLYDVKMAFFHAYRSLAESQVPGVRREGTSKASAGRPLSQHMTTMQAASEHASLQYPSHLIEREWASFSNALLLEDHGRVGELRVALDVRTLVNTEQPLPNTRREIDPFVRKVLLRRRLIADWRELLHEDFPACVSKLVSDARVRALFHRVLQVRSHCERPAVDARVGAAQEVIRPAVPSPPPTTLCPRCSPSDMSVYAENAAMLRELLQRFDQDVQSWVSTSTRPTEPLPFPLLPAAPAHTDELTAAYETNFAQQFLDRLQGSFEKYLAKPQEKFTIKASLEVLKTALKAFVVRAADATAFARVGIAHVINFTPPTNESWAIRCQVVLQRRLLRTVTELWRCLSFREPTAGGAGELSGEDALAQLTKERQDAMRKLNSASTDEEMEEFSALIQVLTAKINTAKKRGDADLLGNTSVATRRAVYTSLNEFLDDASLDILDSMVKGYLDVVAASQQARRALVLIESLGRLAAERAKEEKDRHVGEVVAPPRDRNDDHDDEGEDVGAYALLEQDLAVALWTRSDPKSEAWAMYRIFEVENNIRIRPNQFQMCQQLITIARNPASDAVMYQLFMGDGKTTVILPLLVAVLSSPASAVVTVTVPEALIASTATVLLQRFSGGVPKKVLQLPFSRTLPPSIRQLALVLETIRAELQSCMEQRNVLLQCPEHRLCFELRYHEVLLECLEIDSAADAAAKQHGNTLDLKKLLADILTTSDSRNEDQNHSVSKDEEIEKDAALKSLKKELLEKKFIDEDGNVTEELPDTITEFHERIHGERFASHMVATLFHRLSRRAVAHCKSVRRCRELFERIMEIPRIHILDESDDILRYGSELHYSVGTKQPLHAERFEAAFRIVKLLVNDPETQAYFRGIAESEERSSLVFQRSVDAESIAVPTVRWTAGDAPHVVRNGVSVPLATYIAERFVQEELGYGPVDEGSINNSSFPLALSSSFSMTSDAPGDEASALRQGLLVKFLIGDNSVDASALPLSVRRTLFFTARGWLACGVLDHVLSRRHRVDYGLDSKRRGSANSIGGVAVPFRGSEIASDRAQFAHPDVLIGFTLLSYLYQGLSAPQVKALVQLALQSHRTQLRDWLRSAIAAFRSRTPEAEWTDSLKHAVLRYEGGDLPDTNDGNDIAAAHVLLRNHFEAIHTFLAHIVLPTETMQYPEKISANGCHIAAPPHTVGFSGTDDTRSTMPHRVVCRPFELTIHGKMLHIAARPKNSRVVSVNFSSSRAYLSQVALMVRKSHAATSHPIHVLVDAGAVCCGLSNSDVVRVLMAHPAMDGLFEGCVYCDDATGALVVYVRTRREVLPLNSCQIPPSLLFCFLDDVHTRGIDVKFPPKATGIVTVGENMEKDKLMQAIMRLRQLDYGQRFVLHLHVPLARTIAALNCLADISALKTSHVLRWVTWNTLNHLKRDFPSAVIQSIEHVVHSTALDFQRLAVAAIPQLVQRLKADVQHDPAKLYGNKRTLAFALQYLSKKRTQLTAPLWSDVSSKIPRDVFCFDSSVRGGGGGKSFDAFLKTKLDASTRNLDKLEERAKELLQNSDTLTVSDGPDASEEQEQECQVEVEIEQVREEVKLEASRFAVALPQQPLQDLPSRLKTPAAVQTLVRQEHLVPVRKALAEHLFLELAHLRFPGSLYLTRDFAKTVKDGAQDLGLYLKPPDYVLLLSFGSSSFALPPSSATPNKGLAQQDDGSGDEDIDDGDDDAKPAWLPPSGPPQQQPPTLSAAAGGGSKGSAADSTCFLLLVSSHEAASLIRHRMSTPTHHGDLDTSSSVPRYFVLLKLDAFLRRRSFSCVTILESIGEPASSASSPAAVGLSRPLGNLKQLLRQLTSPLATAKLLLGECQEYTKADVAALRQQFGCARSDDLIVFFERHKKRAESRAGAEVGIPEEGYDQHPEHHHRGSGSGNGDGGIPNSILQSYRHLSRDAIRELVALATSEGLLHPSGAVTPGLLDSIDVDGSLILTRLVQASKGKFAQKLVDHFIAVLEWYLFGDSEQDIGDVGTTSSTANALREQRRRIAEVLCRCSSAVKAFVCAVRGKHEEYRGSLLDSTFPVALH